jgi:membrane protein YdbS with pleckstrin-like domain
LVYLTLGIFKKDSILLRVGLILIAAIVFTVRYYYSILDAEILMIAGGATMILLAWLLTRYLQTPKFGFSSEEGDSKNVMDKLHIESLILAETFSQQPSAGDDQQFGGGDFGGGGASDDF